MYLHKSTYLYEFDFALRSIYLWQNFIFESESPDRLDFYR